MRFFLVTAAVILTVVCLSATGCSKDKKPSLQKGLDAIEAGLPIFSYRYIEDPPEGTILKIDIHQSDINSPCNLYAIDGDVSGAAPFWFLMLRTGSTEPGIYEIIPFWDEFENRDKAQALLNYVEDGTHADRFEAIGGSIEIETAPQGIEEWQSDVPLKAKVSVLFPKKYRGHCSVNA